DPTLQPLLLGTDDNLSDPLTIAKAQGHKPSKKVAGSHQKGKGKQHAVTPDTACQSKGKDNIRGHKHKHVSDGEDDDDDMEEETSKRGRPWGAGNYLAADVSALLDFVNCELPLGQRGWKVVHCNYSCWALLHRHPECTMKSFEMKYKQLVKTPKPMGTAYCPPEVSRAHKIDNKINERACTRDLNDSDFDDNGGSQSGSDVNMEEDGKDEAASSHPTKIRAIICHNGDDDSDGIELMSKLTSALDPSLQQAHNEECPSCSLQNTFLSLSQQLQDANPTIGNLRQQLNNFQTRLHNSERARDHVELRLEMVELSRGHPSQRTRTRCTESTKQTLQCIRGQVRCEEWYPKGGSHTYWVTDPSSSSDDNKENVWFPCHQSPS
ncbi:hypothetical protein L208DRAFT_1173386, partial [Tricholoma matsutake]